MPEDYRSPIVMEHVQRPVAGDPEGDDWDMLEITDVRTGKLLACCPIGHDASVERIADILSAKKLWREANTLRSMVHDARQVRRV